MVVSRMKTTPFGPMNANGGYQGHAPFLFLLNARIPGCALSERSTMAYYAAGAIFLDGLSDGEGFHNTGS